jgi:GNAT superfamily N-acetyltransferase
MGSFASYDSDPRQNSSHPKREPASWTTTPVREPQLSPLDLSDQAIAEALLALQRRAYAVEAELVGSDAIPPLHETLAELQECGETFLGALVEGGLAGAISWRLEDGTLDIHRLVVDPRRSRQGIGSVLVRAAIAAEPDAVRAIVQTGAENAPACALYLREGFQHIDDIGVGRGLRVSRFRKQLG